MHDFLKPIARRWTPLGRPVCGLASCLGPPQLWHRISRPAVGARLQGVYYCQPRCLEIALNAELSRLQSVHPAPLPPNRIPLGLMMVARGKLTYGDVQAALDAQRRAGSGKIGDWIEALGFATEREVSAALALQWGCPVASSSPALIDTAHHVPLSVLENFHMIPWNYISSTNTLHVGFGQRIDHAALYSIEQILGCRTQPCVAPRRVISQYLDAMHEQARPNDVKFDHVHDLAEMSRISANYVARLAPEEIRVARLGRLIWIRLRRRSSATNMVFSLPLAPASPPSHMRSVFSH